MQKLMLRFDGIQNTGACRKKVSKWPKVDILNSLSDFRILTFCCCRLMMLFIVCLLERFWAR